MRALQFAVPFWLMADPRPGTAGTDGVTVTLSPSQQASKLAPRAYEAPVTFTNLTDGQGTTRRTAKLTVLRSATPSQGFLLDESGAHLRATIGESAPSRVERLTLPKARHLVTNRADVPTLLDSHHPFGFD